MKKVLIGMSGGVDSSVAALLLKKQGYEVIGVTMTLFDEEKPNDGCLSNSSLEDAKLICDKLGIKHYVIDLKKEFKKYVIDDFIKNYINGFTPNPCVMCNKYLKFGLLYKKAKELGCDYIATGHYASQKEGKLMISNCGKKDQTYFLYAIDKKILKHLIFPLENFENKEEIRKIAIENDLFVAKKKDSQEICFIPNNDYVSFIGKNSSMKNLEGNFIDKEGNILGRHKGIINYTIGQRKGLGISYKVPLYVIDINTDNNTVTLGEEKDLYSNSLVATNVNLLVDELPSSVEAKIRYRSSLAKAKVSTLDNNDLKIVFDIPQRAITKGQSVVLYKDGVCLGGGIIK